MVRCLRCKAGPEWIEGDPPKSESQENVDLKTENERLTKFAESLARVHPECAFLNEPEREDPEERKLHDEVETFLAALDAKEQGEPACANCKQLGVTSHEHWSPGRAIGDGRWSCAAEEQGE